MIPEKKEKKKEKERPRSFAGVASLFHAEIDPAPSGVKMTIGGIRHVNDVSDTRLSFATEKGEIEVSGSGLLLTVFESHTVGIYGHVEEIKLQYGKH